MHILTGYNNNKDNNFFIIIVDVINFIIIIFPIITTKETCQISETCFIKKKIKGSPFIKSIFVTVTEGLFLGCIFVVHL